MATIENAILEMPTSSPGRTTPMHISCSIVWSEDEIDRGFVINVEVHIWADDDFFQGGDKPLPTTQTTNPELLDNIIKKRPGDAITEFDRTFEVNSATLNEDNSVFNNEDEIFARLRITNLSNAVMATATTNIVEGYFG